MLSPPLEDICILVVRYRVVVHGKRDVTLRVRSIRRIDATAVAFLTLWRLMRASGVIKGGFESPHV